MDLPRFRLEKNAVITFSQQRGDCFKNRMLSRRNDLLERIIQKLRRYLKIESSIEGFSYIIKALEEQGLLKDFWLFSTYLHVSKAATQQIAAKYLVHLCQLSAQWHIFFPDYTHNCHYEGLFLA